MSYELALQTAVYETLTADSTLMSAVNGIYDHVPQSTLYPFISIGEDIATDFDSQGYNGALVNFDINIWTREPNKAGLKTIQGLVYDALHEADFSQSGFLFRKCVFNSSQNFLDDDGETFRGLQTFTVTVEQSS
jgi:hypothetical protein